MYNQNCIYIYKQNYTITNQNWKKHIPLDARSEMIWRGALMIADRNSILEDKLIGTILFSIHTELDLYNIKKTQNYGGAIQLSIVYWSTTNPTGGVCA